MEDKSAAMLSRGWKCDNCGKRTTSEDTHDNNWETLGLSSDTKDFCGEACAKTWGRKHPEELEGEDTWLTDTLARERRQQQGHIATAAPGSPEWYAENPIPDEDRQEHHRDAPFYGVGLDHNDKGWTVHTHRAEWPDRYPSPEEIPDYAIEFIRSTGLKKTAHGGGDDPTVRHCPFCGSGQVVARSDGSVGCQFCNNFFEVSMQPQFSNMPQTDPATGLPLPGAEEEMGDVPGDVPPGADPGVSTDADGVFVPPGTDGGEAGGTDGVFVPPDNAPVTASNSAYVARLLRTAKGATLSEDWFVAHLAISFADNRDRVLETVKATRNG